MLVLVLGLERGRGPPGGGGGGGGGGRESGASCPTGRFSQLDPD